MAKVFEDYFSEIQTDMIAICLEYIEDRAEKIFIYCSCENHVTEGQFFYQINGQILRKSAVNEGLRPGEPPYDVSRDRQRDAIRIISDDIQALVRLCQEYKREMPTQIKIVYDVKKNSVNADYKYDLMYSTDLHKSPLTIINEWIEEEQRKLQNERSNQA